MQTRTVYAPAPTIISVSWFICIPIALEKNSVATFNNLGCPAGLVY